ncbi:hypothetical protein ABVK25_004621 [Lepraria finkii]|uniref:Uncharacterized protein n=1 Tax=Lepraria finkii TaxID=1340010 RepID=A0ABR4BH76_9LECA
MKQGVGGIAGNIGDDYRLVIAIPKYEPNVRCDRSLNPGSSWESFVHVWGVMQALQVQQVFEHSETDPRVDVNLPFTYKTIDARCMMVLDIRGKATRISWYKIWEAVLTVVSMCVRALGKGGNAINIGLRRNMYLVLSDQAPDMDLPTGTSTQGNETLLNALEDLPTSEAQDPSSTAEEGFEPSKPFVIDTSLAQGNGSLVTFPSDTSMNKSQAGLTDQLD